MSVPRHRVEKAQRIICCDTARLLGGKLREPTAIFVEYSIVAEPSLVDPGIGTKQEAIGMAFEQAAPIRGQLSVTANDTTAIGQFAPERILVLVEKFCDAHWRDRKSGMRQMMRALGL